MVLDLDHIDRLRRDPEPVPPDLFGRASVDSYSYGPLALVGRLGRMADDVPRGRESLGCKRRSLLWLN